MSVRKKLYSYSKIKEEAAQQPNRAIDLVTVFDAILTSRQMREKLQ